MLPFFAALVAALLIFWLGQTLLRDELIIVTGCALIVGFITRSTIDKIWSKRHNRTNSSDIFPHLRRHALENWGTKWGHDYEYLNQVVLFDPPLKYPLDVAYILYFDFDTSTPEGRKSEEKFNEINAFQNNVILESGFRDVYRNVPHSEFRDEWFLSIVKYSGFNDQYSWVIYQRKNRH